MASFIRTTMLNRAEDKIASRLRGQAFGSLLITRDMEWFQTESVRDGEAATDEKKDKKGSLAAAKDKKEATKDKDAEPFAATGMTPGAIGAILNEDVGTVAKAVTVHVASLIRSSSSCLFGTYHMLALNPSLFAMSFSVVPLIGTAAVVLRKIVTRVSAKQRETATLAAAFAEERLLNIGMVKMSNREDDEVQKYKELQDETVRLGRIVSVANGMFMGFIFAASSGALFMVFNAGGKAVAAGRMTSGDLTSFATYSFLLGLGTSGIFKAASEMVQGMVCAERVYRLIGVDSDKDDSKTETEKASTDKAVPSLNGSNSTVDASTIDSIAFEDVQFAYSSNPSSPVLQGLSFELKRGTVVALVGKNGSGKTTIASLLAALYRPQSGRIVLSSDKKTDYNSLDRNSQKQVVQIVPQQPALFNTSILENVRYSKPEATEKEAVAAMDAANCNFVDNLEGGIQYQVGLTGGKLSGGQRQRLGLARAMLSDPAVLVLDEPTSALDAEGEAAVEDTVRACRGTPGRALLLITHRAKSLQLADIVMVLRDGVIVEQGTFKALSAKKDSHLCVLMPDLH